MKSGMSTSPYAGMKSLIVNHVAAWNGAVSDTEPRLDFDAGHNDE
jgi:hypothetical protein